MPADTFELKRIIRDVLGSAASANLLDRLCKTVDQAPDPQTGAERAEKIVALFLGAGEATTLKQGFQKALS